MGLCSSSDGKDEWPKEAKRDPAFKWSYELKQHPPRTRQKIRDPAHYQAKHLRNETFTRGPGSINGDQIQIEDCEDCDIYLCDEMDSVVMDDCKHCRIFIGPTSGSVFLRTSSDCKIVILCGQLRLRDCTDLDLSVYCSSKPVIESSKRISFCCFDGYYFNLKEQLDVSRMSVFNNRWSDIHDFTPKNALNYSYSAPTRALADVIHPLSLGLPDFISQEEERNPNGEVVVPKTWGLRELPATGEHGVVVFLPNELDACLGFLQKLATLPELLLVQTKESIVPGKDAPHIFARSQLSKDQRRAIVTGPTIAVGVFGPSAIASCQRLVGGSASAYSAANPAEASYLFEQLFEKHQLGGDFKA